MKHLQLLLILTLSGLSHQAPADNGTVIGPRNVDLAEGAREIELGDPKLGVQLTRRGLAAATSRREREVGLANLCAGHAMLRELETALAYCDQLLALNDRSWRGYNNRAVIHVLLGEYDLAEQDLLAGEAINPAARRLKQTRAMLRDAVDPVVPRITIDDRTDGPPVKAAR